jgi:RimJ/RimL family protein N-acetyltransferase
MTTTASRPSVEATRVALADGREVTIRELLGTDAPALLAALEAADPVDLRRRFMGGPPPTSMLVERLKAADGVHNLALGAFADDGELVGVAQFDRADDGPVAEIAIEVATGWQTQGLGTALLARLAVVALERGVHHFTATFYADNVPLRRLLRDLAPLVHTSYADGEGIVDLDLDAPGATPA